MVIKKLNIENPFADNAGIVTGERFIGRQTEINQIHTRILGNLYGNLAVVGLPRIGKSSLAWNALIPLREQLIQDKHIISYISISSGDNAHNFFKGLVLAVLEEIESAKVFNDIYPKLKVLYSQILEYQSDRFELLNRIKKFFKFCKTSNIRITLILDEFDYSERIFSVADFQFLRELSTLPDTKICLLTISRRTIQELEPENGAISNFYGVFSELRLQLFNENDLKTYWQRIETLGLEISEEYKKAVYYFVGSHPYWLDMVNYHIFNAVKSGSTSSLDLLFEIGSDLKKNLWDNYEAILNLMEKEGLKSHFIQAIVGPVINLTQMSIEKLIKYGLIKPILAREKYGTYFQLLVESKLVDDSDISYNSISNHLNDYLKQRESEFDIWGLWTEVENEVRYLITIYLKEKFGDDWRNAFLSANPQKKNYILHMEELRNKTKRTFGNLASDNLVSYSYPFDLWNCFISTDWLWFKEILHGEELIWREKFLLLAKVRNPIAHSNRDFVVQDELNKAKQICDELHKKISEWLKN